MAFVSLLVLRTAGLKKEELQQLFRQEEEFFHRQCNQFTSAQLDMTSAEMENFLKIQGTTSTLLLYIMSTVLHGSQRLSCTIVKK